MPKFKVFSCYEVVSILELGHLCPKDCPRYGKPPVPEPCLWTEMDPTRSMWKPPAEKKGKQPLDEEEDW